MDMNENYTTTKECDYEGEHYSVRDNGAVMRHPKNGRNRPNDNRWTFGTPDKEGYPAIAGTRVHRIVAVAFLPPPERDDFVVDHIDTNRQNNRPTNLRWISRLDNIVLNENTRKKIEYITGMKIEDVLKDMSVLRESRLPSNYSWMCAISQEEADRSLELWHEWAEKPSKTISKQELTIKKQSERGLNNSSSIPKGVPFYVANSQLGLDLNQYLEPEPEVTLKNSRTSGVVLDDWIPDGDFPLCPGVGHSLQEYLANLKEGAIIYRNDFNHEVSVMAAEISDDGNTLMVRGYDARGTKPYYVITVTMMDGRFVHKRDTYFEEIGQEKSYPLGLGRAWTGGDCIDDFCL